MRRGPALNEQRDSHGNASPIAPTQSVAVEADRGRRAPPPISDPIGIVPQTMNRIVAFIRPCIAVGVMAWRKLTWLML